MFGFLFRICKCEYGFISFFLGRIYGIVFFVWWMIGGKVVFGEIFVRE